MAQQPVNSECSTNISQHTNTKKDAKSKTKSLIRNSAWFVSFNELPSEHDLDLSYYQECGYGEYRPSRHWCLIGEIIEDISFMRPRCTVRDMHGTKFGVHFYLDNTERFDSKTLQKGSLFCLRYCSQHFFMDGQIGIRVEDTDPWQVIPKLSLSKLLSISDTGCLMDYYQANVLNMREHVVLNNTCWHKGCDKAGTGGRALQKCGGCKMARYCCKEHQVEDWKSKHSFECKHWFPKITKLFAINLNRFHRFQSF